LVTAGLTVGVPDERLIRENFAKGTFRQNKVRLSRLEGETEIHTNEKATIELALNRRADFVLLDDAASREAALRYGLELNGTLGITLDAVHGKFLLKEETVLLVKQIKQPREIWIRDSLCDLVL
jgi:predicted nucleic acid-binding protein